MMDAIHVIRRPLITEKATHESEAHNRHSFSVVPHARKPEIKRAVEALYGVRVTKVRTQRRQGKMVRTRYGYSKAADWKRAIVELHEDDRIDVF